MTEDDILPKLDEILDRMAANAEGQGIQGVAVAGYYETGSGLISQAKVCGRLADEKCNYLAIAYSKLSEMCLTLKDSGLPGRSVLLGELGYAGGAVKPVGAGYFQAAFSGGTSEEDLLASRAGLESV